MATHTQSDSATNHGWSILGLSDARFLLIAASCFINAILAVMGDVLFAGGARVLSAPGGGIDARFASLRAFTAQTLSAGQLPLWNPTVFSGMAHVGGFESGLYYPLSLPYRILPLAPAINWGIALHLFLFALFMYCWLRRHEVHPIAAIYGGIVAMFSGVYFLDVSRGDLSVFEAFTWCPAMLIAVHCLARGQLVAGVLGGVLVFTMQILCGYPIATVYTGTAAFLYGVFLMTGRGHRGTVMRGGMAIVLATPFLAAVQLWIGLDTFTRSTRFRGDAVSLLAEKSIGVGSFRSAVVPWAETFARSSHTATLFVGVVTLVAAVAGLVFGRGRFRFAAAAITGFLLLLSWIPGRPLFATLVTHLPPMRYVVQPDLFVVPAALFIIAIACFGMDRLIRDPKSAMPMAGIAVVFTVALGIAAIGARYVGTDSDGVARGLLLSSGVTLCAATLLSLVPVKRWFRFGVLVLGIGEMVVFALVHRPTTELEQGSDSAAPKYAERVLDLDWRNPAPGSGTYSASGNAALVSRRYMALLSQTQWVSMPTHWNGPFEFVGYHPLHRMLRVGGVADPSGGEADHVVQELLPRFLLVSDYVVERDSAAAFAVMDQPTFDPWRTVVLEREPTPKPQGVVGDVPIDVMDETVNGMVIELTLPSPAILLMTDAFERGWRARGLTSSSQWRYDVMPANIALRAMPLGAGTHRIQLEYVPLSFRFGQWVSLGTALGFVVLGLAAVWRRWGSDKE